MSDMAKLRGRIAEKGMTQQILAEKTSMDRSTLNRKLKTGDTFTIGEAVRLARALNLSKDDVAAIFFTDIVA